MKDNQKRLLAFNMSKQISDSELQDVMAGGSIIPTGNATYQNGSFDGNVDVNTD